MKTILVVLASVASFIPTITTTQALPGELPPDPSAVAYHRAQAQMDQEEMPGVSPSHSSLRGYPRVDREYTGEIADSRRAILSMTPIGVDTKAYFGFTVDLNRIRVMPIEEAEVFCGYTPGSHFGSGFGRKGVLKISFRAGARVGVNVLKRRIECDMYCLNPVKYLGPPPRLFVPQPRCTTCPQARPRFQVCRICRGPIIPRQHHRCLGGYPDQRFGGHHRQGDDWQRMEMERRRQMMLLERERRRALAELGGFGGGGQRGHAPDWRQRRSW